MNTILTLVLIAVAGLAAVIYFYITRLNRTAIETGFNSAVWAMLDSNDETMNGQAVLVVSGLSMKNRSRKPVTIERISFRFDYNGESLDVLPDTIPLRTDVDAQGEVEELLDFHNTRTGKKVTMRWYDPEVSLPGDKTLPAGASAGCSLAFYPGMQFSETKKIENKRVVVRDANGNETEQTLMDITGCSCGAKESWWDDYVTRHDEEHLSETG